MKTVGKAQSTAASAMGGLASAIQGRGAGAQVELDQKRLDDESQQKLIFHNDEQEYAYTALKQAAREGRLSREQADRLAVLEQTMTTARQRQAETFTGGQNEKQRELELLNAREQNATSIKMNARTNATVDRGNTMQQQTSAAQLLEAAAQRASQTEQESALQVLARYDGRTWKQLSQFEQQEAIMSQARRMMGEGRWARTDLGANNITQGELEAAQERAVMVLSSSESRRANQVNEAVQVAGQTAGAEAGARQPFQLEQIREQATQQRLNWVTPEGATPNIGQAGGAASAVKNPVAILKMYGIGEKPLDPYNEVGMPSWNMDVIQRDYPALAPAFMDGGVVSQIEDSILLDYAEALNVQALTVASPQERANYLQGMYEDAAKDIDVKITRAMGGVDPALAKTTADNLKGFAYHYINGTIAEGVATPGPVISAGGVNAAKSVGAPTPKGL